MSESVPTALAFVFDSNKLKFFLHRVAAARVAAGGTRARWAEYKSGGVLDAVYALK